VLRIHHVETDSLDRSAFESLVERPGELARLAEEGSRLLPHFPALLRDLFATLYKLVTLRFPGEEMRPSVRVHGFVLDRLEEARVLAPLRERTGLDVPVAGLATVQVGERILAWLRRSEAFTEEELLEAFRSAEAEEGLERAREGGKVARMLSEQAASSRGRDSLSSEARRRDSEGAQAEQTVQQARESSERAVDGVPRQAVAKLDRELANAPRRLEELEQALETWELEVEGSPTPSVDAARRIDLGRRLTSNPKLVQLAAWVGRLREQERALRASRVPRRSQETYAVGTGGDPGRLLPGELLRLRHPGGRRDLLRRIIEGTAAVYELRGLDRRGSGPMLLCLDCSSSMAGPKELWSKAVTLTLMDLARRRKRLFEVIAFTGADAPLVHFPLLARCPGRGIIPRTEEILGLAEHFPGGATSFEKPLSAALDRVDRGPSRGRADIVLLTDGQASVSAAFLDHLNTVRRRREVGILSVLMDTGPSTAETVRRFSDRVTTVGTLTDEAAREVFLKLTDR
jgi:uncharacterized protein with von Willebrand factor type A (vWA) domain